jgi:hypothetical protein
MATDEYLELRFPKRNVNTIQYFENKVVIILNPRHVKRRKRKRPQVISDNEEEEEEEEDEEKEEQEEQEEQEEEEEKEEQEEQEEERILDHEKQTQKLSDIKGGCVYICKCDPKCTSELCEWWPEKPKLESGDVFPKNSDTPFGYMTDHKYLIHLGMAVEVYYETDVVGEIEGIYLGVLENIYKEDDCFYTIIRFFSWSGHHCPQEDMFSSTGRDIPLSNIICPVRKQYKTLTNTVTNKAMNWYSQYQKNSNNNPAEKLQANIFSLVPGRQLWTCEFGSYIWLNCISPLLSIGYSNTRTHVKQLLKYFIKQNIQGRTIQFIQTNKRVRGTCDLCLHERVLSLSLHIGDQTKSFGATCGKRIRGFILLIRNISKFRSVQNNWDAITDHEFCILQEIISSCKEDILHAK